MALLGSAAGTAANQFLAIYGAQARVDAVEIDQTIVDIARRDFGMRDSAVAGGNPNYHVHVADGRTWLAAQGAHYDVIGVDAYHQPYIPFHLTTVEFFRMVRDHLNPQGVVVLNAGLGADGDVRLAQTLATTMLEVFPNVFVLETAQFGNWMLVGSMAHIGDGAENFAANYRRVDNAALRTTMATVTGFAFLPHQRGEIVLYDDHAPVERLVDEMIFGAVR
jgi:spermidine synthase